jgi:hypothetical protein
MVCVGVLLCVYQLTGTPSRDDHRGRLDASARALFKYARGREPSARELEALRCVLYRNSSDAATVRDCTATLAVPANATK